MHYVSCIAITLNAVQLFYLSWLPQDFGDWIVRVCLSERDEIWRLVSAAVILVPIHVVVHGKVCPRNNLELPWTVVYVWVLSMLRDERIQRMPHLVRLFFNETSYCQAKSMPITRCLAPVESIHGPRSVVLVYFLFCILPAATVISRIHDRRQRRCTHRHATCNGATVRHVATRDEC